MEKDMTKDSAEQKVTRGLLHALAKKHISKECLERSLVLSGFLPDKNAWYTFIHVFFLLLGITLVLTGISFFFAYNWSSLHKFAKLGIVQLGILACLGGVLYKGLDSLVGKALLFAASVLVGTFLAVFGQIYQTGADAYELFVGWFFFIIGWTAISNNTGLCFLSLLILNLAIVLGMVQTGRVDRPWEWCFLFEILCAIQFLPLLVWESFSSRLEWMRVRWFPRILVFALLYFLVFPVMIYIFSRTPEDRQYLSVQIAPLLYGSFTAFLFYFYQYKKQDLSILTMNCIALIIVVSCSFGKFLVDSIHDVIFLSILVIVQASLASIWLRKVWKKWTM